MDNQRLVLFIALSLVILMIFTTWQAENQPPATAVVETGDTGIVADLGVAAPADTPAAIPTMKDSSAEAKMSDAQLAASPTAIAAADGQRITVSTDVLNLVINTAGGEISRVSLPMYPAEQNTPEVPFQLLDDRMPRYFVAQSGLLASQGKAPDHHAIYRVEQTEYVLADGRNDLKVV
ncbi:MAG: membrane protein insertase YidC, partial [Porticoccus sp.]|nr:membrane protein insertase YidC [Porticoccus sp.]